MEKENKYYNVIEQLIRKHKKFSGLEDILDDIINDVYSHSEVILNTVSNESVVNAYLEKVVSTSIITVPKQMNYHPKVSSATVTVERISSKPVTPEKVIKVDNKLVDNMINGASSDTTELNIEEDSVEEFEILDSSSESIEILDEAEPFVESIEENDTTDIIANEEEENNNIIEETFASEEISDEIIADDENTIDLPEPIEEITSDVELLLEESEEAELDSEDETVLDNSVTISETEFETVDLDVDVEPEFPAQQFEIDEKSPDVDEKNNYAQDEMSLEIESSTEDSFELALDDMTETTEYEPIVDTAFSEDLIENNELLDDSIEEFLEEPQAELLEEELETDSLEEIVANESYDMSDISDKSQNEESQSNFIPTDYSVFDFNPQNVDSDDSIDTDLIAEDLTKLSEKYPELNILDIYNLKYKENLSISKVATKLDVSENKVIEALNEIIAVI